MPAESPFTLERLREAMQQRRAFWALLRKPIAEVMGYEPQNNGTWRDEEGNSYDRQGRGLGG